MGASKVYECPYKTHQGSHIMGCHFPFGHGNNQMFLQEYQFNEVIKAFYHFFY